MMPSGAEFLNSTPSLRMPASVVAEVNFRTLSEGLLARREEVTEDSEGSFMSKNTAGILALNDSTRDHVPNRVLEVPGR